MNEGPAILCVGVEAGDLAELRREMPDQELISAAGSSDAVECLRRREHGIPLVLVGENLVGGETDELVVFLRGTFPDLVLAAVLKPSRQGADCLGLVSGGLEVAHQLEHVGLLP